MNDKLKKITLLMDELEQECEHNISVRDEYDPVIEEEKAILDVVFLVRRILDENL